MIGGLFIYNHKGEVWISRVYRDDIGTPTSGWQPSPSGTSTAPQCSSSSARCVTSCPLSEENVDNNFVLIYELPDDQRGAVSDHLSGDGSDRLEAGRNQGQTQQAPPGRVGQHQPAPVPARSGAQRSLVGACGDEELPERNARV